MCIFIIFVTISISIDIYINSYVHIYSIYTYTYIYMNCVPIFKKKLWYQIFVCLIPLHRFCCLRMHNRVTNSNIKRDEYKRNI